MDARAATLIAEQSLPMPAGARLEAHALRGGLESAVARVVVRSPGPAAGGLMQTLVVKKLVGAQRREAEVYRLLWQTLAQPPAARVLAHRDTADAAYLCLENVRSVSAWPWRDPATAVAACEALARLHQLRPCASELPPSNHEQDLLASAQQTLQLAATARVDGMPVWRRLGDLRRVVGALGTIRSRLLQSEATLIHGDVHPGNVLVRGGAGPDRVVFIDWATARIGSPLEDAASWLHSLGCWDAEARRRHDSLLVAYLRARGRPARLDATLRADYWLASASNGLAGAIRYHCVVLLDPLADKRARRESRRALDEWQRVMRLAAALLAAPGGRRSRMH
jgi:aminoglycoside phosphotransferase (APT) family kinase protein